MAPETVYGQTLALLFENGDEHRALESDTTGLNVKGNLYLLTHNRKKLRLGHMCHGEEE